jgi:hypothetical protein
VTRIIEIIIAPDGQSRVETKGFSGSECRDASRLLEAAIGKTTSEKLTAEFHQTQASQHDHLEQR